MASHNFLPSKQATQQTPDKHFHTNKAAIMTGDKSYVDQVLPLRTQQVPCAKAGRS